jgi:hypothetical protein
VNSGSKQPATAPGDNDGLKRLSAKGKSGGLLDQIPLELARVSANLSRIGGDEIAISARETAAAIDTRKCVLPIRDPAAMRAAEKLGRTHCIHAAWE